HADVGRVVHARAAGPVHDLHGREGMHVERRVARLDGGQDVPVGEGVHVGVDAPLHAHLGGAAADRFLHLAEHEVQAVGVSVGLPALPLEGAELAVHEADVGEIDVAVDDVGDLVADVGGAHGVGGADQGAEI